MRAFVREGCREPFTEICQQHSQVIPDESYTALTSPDERLRAIALLQQKAHLLEAEIAQRKEAEKRLWISENRYRLLFETSTDGILMVDPHTGIISEANPSLIDLLGYTHEQVIGQKLWQIDLFEDQQACLEALRELQEKYILRYAALSLRTQDGEHRYVEFVATLYQANGHPIIQCNLRDITDRQQIQEALHASEEYFRTAFAVARVGQQLVGLNGDEEVQKTKIIDYFPSQERERVTNDILLHLPERGAWNGEMVFRHFQTGACIPVLWNVFVIQDEETGHVQNFACIARDITERKRIEEERFRLAAIVVSSDDAIISKTLDGTITSWNNAAEQMFGYSAEEAIGKHITLIIPPELHQEEVEIISKIRQGIQIRHYETIRQRKDGNKIHVSLSISPVRDSTGHIIGAAKIARDIAERRELEQRKDNFISMASHELKTPITSLRGFIQILQKHLKQQADPQTQLFLGRMDAQVKKLTNLISDLLDVSKMQTGALAFHKTNIDLDELVRETVENVQAAVTSHHIYLQEGIETHIQVYGDRDRLEQVLINLLTNAIKYSPEANTVIVRLSRDHKQVEVAVQDFGRGITEEHHERIFERFYQVTDPQEKAYPGLGIGLYIARTIVEQHDGRLWLESQQGAGSTFHFILPLLKEEPDVSRHSAPGEEVQ